MRCRLCWRITLGVFALIVAVESVILVPSGRRFERTEWQRVAARAQIMVESALAGARGADAAKAASSVIGLYGLRSVAIYDSRGALIAQGGEPPAPPFAAARGDMAGLAGTGDGGRTLTAAWLSHAIARATVVARVEASAVPARLRAYLLRVAGLVGIIVVVVTVGTMLILDLSLLRPLLRLRESSLAAGADPEHAEAFVLGTRRRDEMGELIAAHDAMLAQVAESRRRDREMAEERARFLTHHDPSTGLPNGAALLEFLAHQGEAANPVTLLHLNVQRFRLVNSTYGAQAGERVLCALARRLQHAAAPGDLLARIGADRFAVARGGEIPPHEAHSLAERLLRHAAPPIEVSAGNEVSLAVRIGIAQTDGPDVSGEDLVSRAELALSRTYEDPACKYQFYSADLAEQAREHQLLAQDLERALQRDELFVVLQPKFELARDGAAALSGAEALLRWRHPERGPVSPAKFIPIAESTGLVDALTELVLRAVGERIRAWRARYGWSPRVAVNLSAQQFGRADLAAWLSRLLAESGAPPGLVEVEITETAAMRDVLHSVAAVGELRGLGLRVSIDDFGTGYSSLSYLRRFAVDAIKIDKSFVDDIGRDRHAEAVCSAILRLGQSLGMRVVAEGVETAAQADFLRRRKCDEVQGFLFGKPLAPVAFEQAWLRDMPAAHATALLARR